MNNQQIQQLIAEYQRDPSQFSPEEAAQIRQAAQQMGASTEASSNGGFLGQLLYSGLDSALLGLLPNKEPMTESEATGSSIGSMLGSLPLFLLGGKIAGNKLGAIRSAEANFAKQGIKESAEKAFQEAFGEKIGGFLGNNSIARKAISNPEYYGNIIGGAIGGGAADILGSGPNIPGALMGGFFPVIQKKFMNKGVKDPYSIKNEEELNALNLTGDDLKQVKEIFAQNKRLNQNVNKISKGGMFDKDKKGLGKAEIIVGDTSLGEGYIKFSDEKITNRTTGKEYNKIQSLGTKLTKFRIFEGTDNIVMNKATGEAYQIRFDVKNNQIKLTPVSDKQRVFIDRKITNKGYDVPGMQKDSEITATYIDPYKSKLKVGDKIYDRLKDNFSDDKKFLSSDFVNFENGKVITIKRGESNNRIIDKVQDLNAYGVKNLSNGDKQIGNKIFDTKNNLVGYTDQNGNSAYFSKKTTNQPKPTNKNIEYSKEDVEELIRQHKSYKEFNEKYPQFKITEEEFNRINSGGSFDDFVNLTKTDIKI